MYKKDKEKYIKLLDNLDITESEKNSLITSTSKSRLEKTVASLYIGKSARILLSTLFFAATGGTLTFLAHYYGTRPGPNLLNKASQIVSYPLALGTAATVLFSGYHSTKNSVLGGFYYIKSIREKRKEDKNLKKTKS